MGGLKIGKFEILDDLGQGAMGRVYRARDPVLDRPVALKTISPALLSGEDALKRFLREGKAAARLQHPNVVTIFEIGEVEGTHYIAMELVEGMDLGEAMTPADRYTVEQKVRLLADVCRTLDFAHKMGVFHRDIKPANIRITKDGVVKILDFGIARLGTDTTLTQTGVAVGTPSYMSPEILKGEPVDHRADMWAVGVILYEMLAGRRPFEAKTIGSLITKILHEPLPPLDARALQLPEALEAVVARALDKDPGRRFADLQEMARAMLEAIGAAPPPEPMLDPALRRRAYEANFADARQRLAEDDLSGALESAKRARDLDPTRTGIVALIRAIEERMRSATTVRRVPPREEMETPRPTRTLHTGLASAATAVEAGPITAAELRGQGAAAFRDHGTFGEPPATKEVSLSPVKELLALAGADGAIRLWDLRSRTRTRVLRTALHQRSGHDAAALGLAFAPDGALLASGHVDGSVHLWDMERGQELPVRLRHDDAVSALAFSPDGARLATGSLDSNLRLWDVGAAVGGEARRLLIRQPAGVTALTWAGGGEWILTGHTSRVLRLTDAARGRLVGTLRGPESLVNVLVPSPDGGLVAVASRDGTLRLFDLASREQTALLEGLRKPVTSACFVADGLFLATVGRDNAVQLWDLETLSPSAALWGPADESFVGLAVFGEGRQIAVALADGRIRTWTAA
jgi:hypothetical protein